MAEKLICERLGCPTEGFRIAIRDANHQSILVCKQCHQADGMWKRFNNVRKSETQKHRQVMH